MFIFVCTHVFYEGEKLEGHRFCLLGYQQKYISVFFLGICISIFLCFSHIKYEDKNDGTNNFDTTHLTELEQNLNIIEETL